MAPAVGPRTEVVVRLTVKSDLVGRFMQEPGGDPRATFPQRRTPPAGGQAGSSLGTCRGGLRIAEAYASNAPRPVAFPGSGARAARRHQKQSRAEVRCGTLPSVAHASHTKERVLAWGTPKRNGIFGQSLPARNGSNPVALNGRTLARITQRAGARAAPARQQLTQRHHQARRGPVREPSEEARRPAARWRRAQGYPER
jgi:hypothetical protein